MNTTYKRTIEELRNHAILHWPDAVLIAAGDASVLPLLLQTQESFISLLKFANKSPLAWQLALQQSKDLSGPLFLKHLMVLSDLGGEALNKLPPLSKYYTNNKIEFTWNSEMHIYVFKEIHNKCSLANSSLAVDSKRIIKGGKLTNKMIDVAMLLLFGSQSINDTLPTEVKDRCIIGSLIGNVVEIEKFVKSNYIRVSRQVSGATANELGHNVQSYVVTELQKALPTTWQVLRDATLPGVSHKEGYNTNFDIVVISENNKYYGVEVSFQVTTNSVIERKSREADSMQRNVHSNGHKICYVIDGAGNINIRANAVSTLCNYSDCTVAMSESEIRHLANFMINSELNRNL